MSIPNFKYCFDLCEQAACIEKGWQSIDDNAMRQY